MPVDLSEDALADQRGGSTALVVGNAAGTVLRIGVLAPGSRSPMHRSHSLDYGICLAGECELELDGGDTVTVRVGDIVVQRGTNHLWHNRGSKECRFAWILIDAQPPQPSA
jgi:quercetin dioxygenase-like cupin family protein